MAPRAVVDLIVFFCWPTAEMLARTFVVCLTSRHPPTRRCAPMVTDDVSTASSTGARVGGGAASNALAVAGRGGNPLRNSEIVTNLASFFDDSVYLFMGGVSRCWNDAWRRQRLPQETSGISSTTTPGQLRHSFACGLERKSSVCVAAARLKKLDLLQVARDAGCPWHADVAIELVRGGFTGALKEACSGEDACPLTEGLIDTAAECSRWGDMRWLFDQGCPCSPRTMAAIAANAGRKGNVGPDALLQLARSRGAPLGVATSVNLARRGLEETLTWVVEEGCPIKEETSAAAAQGGHMDVLVWLRSQNCPWDVETCKQVRAHPSPSTCAAAGQAVAPKRLRFSRACTFTDTRF